MSFVGLVDVNNVGADLRALYEGIRQNFGFLPNYFLALGRMADIVGPHLTLNEQVMKDGALPQAVKEQIGMVVSGINSSSYCVAIHMEMLRKLGVEKQVARKLAVDYPHAPVGENVQALFRFADRLTRKPAEIDKKDVDALRAAGWDDSAIVETVVAVAYFGFINRISLGLGLVADF